MPASPIVVQAAGDHGTDAVVFVLLEMLPLAEVKVGALSIAWA